MSRIKTPAEFYEELRRDAQEFNITEDHLKLARRMYVEWDDMETGAPSVDPKRPYGNSDVPGDMHEILTGSEWDWDAQEMMPEYLDEYYRRLHAEMGIVLQIALTTGKFEAGHYVKRDFHWAAA